MKLYKSNATVYLTIGPLNAGGSLYRRPKHFSFRELAPGFWRLKFWRIRLWWYVARELPERQEPAAWGGSA